MTFWINDLLSATLRLATPLLLAAMGGLLSERSGVINIALEGFMLVGAFVGAASTFASHSPWVGFLTATGAGALCATLYAGLVLRWRANQIVAGMALNMLALGLTPELCKMLYDATGSSPAIPLAQRFRYAPIIMSWMAVALCWALLRFSPWGLRLGFAGEHPEALDAAGVRVNRVRFLALLAGGALAGIAGASLSIMLSSSFSRAMTGGRGFIALAALIFGKWKPLPAAAGCLLFGFADALQMRLQGASVGGHPVPVQFVQIIPYVITILVLAGFVGRARPPRALGKVFERE